MLSLPLLSYWSILERKGGVSSVVRLLLIDGNYFIFMRLLLAVAGHSLQHHAPCNVILRSVTRRKIAMRVVFGFSLQSSGSDSSHHDFYLFSCSRPIKSKVATRKCNKNMQPETLNAPNGFKKELSMASELILTINQHQFIHQLIHRAHTPTQICLSFPTNT